MEWYTENKTRYLDAVEHYVNRFPDKYYKEIILMPKKKIDEPAKIVGKQIAVVTADGQITKVMGLEDVKKIKVENIGDIESCRLIELTGKEYEFIISVAVKQKPLDKIKTP
ncbi:MAG: hypothetical protein Q8M92_04285 [Candidatus Subteraquimicrobiales bacterium]|nr:hypothetical protein [Candidatus Subteraquimicrobiales bacterium]